MTAADDGGGFDPSAFLRQLTTRPGVYRMLDAAGDLLYVGKARNLKKRVSTYFMRASGDPRIEQMVGQIRQVEVTVTPSEDEALLLENQLIKSLRPRYNVCLRDDKSYPYIRFTAAHAYPRIVFHRGARDPKDVYFGPFPSAATVRETISMLQRVFMLRPCSDSYFSNRTRPCLQHQIKRCSAPCVGLIEQEAYATDVEAAIGLLKGQGEALIEKLAEQMDQQSRVLNFEQAAQTRDRIGMLRRIQEQRVVTGSRGDLDVIVVGERSGLVAVLVLSIRDGRNLGHRAHFPIAPGSTPPSEVLSAFIGQYYLAHEAPDEVLTDLEPDDSDWLEHSLGLVISPRLRGQRRKLVQMARSTLTEMISARLVSRTGIGARLQALADVLELDEPPQRLECFDISHSRGEAPVASCVVFDTDGPLKSAYRRFNIEGITPGDDYAAIRSAVSRRYTRIKKGEAPLPDVLFIDGGQGQLSAAQEALTELGMLDSVALVAVAKGPSRKPGKEQLLMPDRTDSVRLAADDPALHLIQQIRDESHRFAITGHRGRRGKARTVSVLDEIAGLGPRRRASLLRTFGGMRQIERAAVDDLARVPGFSLTLAQRVYDHIHDR